MNRQSISPAGLVALVLAVLGIGLGAYGLYRAGTTQAALTATSATLEASVARSEAIAKRVGMAVTMEPARETDVPNVALDPTNLPPPITRTEPTTVQITLTATEVVGELADGTTYAFWTFDNTVPGPMVRVMEGDTVEITLVNPETNSVGHNIDLHAVNGPGGGANVSNVNPGETKTFSFKALNPGIYVYHCAFAPPQHHIAQGMYGAVLVEPVGGLPPVDREFYVMQGEWYTQGPFGSKGHQVFSTEKALAEHPEYFTFNGHVNALTTMYPLHAEVGETVRMYFGVGGPNIGSNFHIIGEVFDRVWKGSDDTYTANGEAWYVSPGSVSAFEMHLDVPGQYILVDHALYRTQKGAAGYMNVTGEWDPEIYFPEPGMGGH